MIVNNYQSLTILVSQRDHHHPCHLATNFEDQPNPSPIEADVNPIISHSPARPIAKVASIFEVLFLLIATGLVAKLEDRCDQVYWHLIWTNK